jgi:DNA-binding CsgD family transcriptional regulator
LQVILNKKEKEELVAKLYLDGKTIREIACQAHLSFGTIGKIIRRINGLDNDEIPSDEMRGKSKSAQAMNLFLHGKRPVEVAIELDLSANEIEEMQQEFWVLNGIDGRTCFNIS